MTNPNAIPKKEATRGMALLGWTAGAVVAMGAYFGALALYPAAPTSSVIASIPDGVDRVLGEGRQAAAVPVIASERGRQDRLSPGATPLSGEIIAQLDAQNEAIDRLNRSLTTIEAPLDQLRERLAELEAQQGNVLSRLDTVAQEQDQLSTRLAMVDQPIEPLAGDAIVAMNVDIGGPPEDPLALGEGLPSEGNTPSSQSGAQVQELPATAIASPPPPTPSVPTPNVAQRAPDTDPNPTSLGREAVSNGTELVAFERRQSETPDPGSGEPAVARVVLPSGSDPGQTVLLRDPTQGLQTPAEQARAAIAVTSRPLEPNATEIASISAPDLDASLLDIVVDEMLVEALQGTDEVITGSLPSSPAPIDQEALSAPELETPPLDGPSPVLTQSAFAVDLGGVATLEEIDRLWMERSDTYDSVLMGMTPRILLRQTPDGQLDLRLLAGPIDDAADAALKCAQLVANGLEECLPSIYDGQLLSLRP